MRRAALLAWLVGSIAMASSTVIIWVLRAGYDGYVYVSGLGAEGEPSAVAFNAALLALGAGGMLLGWSVYAVTPPKSRAASAALLIFAAGACFVVASRVSCSAGCPAPGSDGFAPRDAGHLTAAITGFALACLAMLVIAVRSRRRLRRSAAGLAAVLVAGLSATGGLLALSKADQQIGAWLEFAAMTIAVAWFVADATIVVLAAARTRGVGSPSPGGEPTSQQRPPADLLTRDA